MRSISSFTIILFLLVFTPQPVLSQDEEIIWLNINTDKQIYAPGETVYFFLNANNNGTGKVDLYFKNELFRSLEFNMTEGITQVYWKSEIYTTNSSYTAVATFDNIENLNATIKFGMKRDDLPLDVFRFFYVNASIQYKDRSKRDYRASITNLYTNESLTFDSVDEYFYMSNDDEEEDLIKYKPGHAILIEVKTNDRLYEGSIIFAANLGINQITIQLHKLPNDRKILSFLFPIFILFIIIFYIYKNRHKFNKSKYSHGDELEDPFSIENI